MMMMTTMMVMPWKKRNIFLTSSVLLLWCFLRTYNTKYRNDRTKNHAARKWDKNSEQKKKTAPPPSPPSAVLIWTAYNNNYAKGVLTLYKEYSEGPWYDEHRKESTKPILQKQKNRRKNPPESRPTMRRKHWNPFLWYGIIRSSWQKSSTQK